MNNLYTVNASKNNNSHHTAQSVSVTSNGLVNQSALNAYWLHCTLCVVIFGHSHCVQTVHTIIFCPAVENLYCIRYVWWLLLIYFARVFFDRNFPNVVQYEMPLCQKRRTPNIQVSHSGNDQTFKLMAHNWQKWKSRFLTFPCHKIYGEEAVGLKSSKYS